MLQQKFQDVQTSMMSQLIDMDHVIRTWFKALISEKSFLIISDPGYAKTLLYRVFLAHIEDIMNKSRRAFYMSLHSHVKVEEVVGPLDVKQFQAGEYTRCMEHYIEDSLMAFALLDELPRAKSIKSIFLNLLAEKIIKIGNKEIQSNLISILACVNSEMKDPEDKALNERFAFRVEISNQLQDSFIENLVMSKGKRKSMKKSFTAQHFLSIADIQQAQTESSAIIVETPAIAKAVQDIYHELAKNSIRLSPRTIEWWLEGAQAEAWLEGRGTLDPVDLSVGNDMLWMFLEQRPKVQKTINSIVNAELDTFYNKLEDAKKITESFHGDMTLNDIKESIQKLKKIRDAFENHKFSKRNESERNRVLAAIKQYHADACNIGMDKMKVAD